MRVESKCWSGLRAVFDGNTDHLVDEGVLEAALSEIGYPVCPTSNC